MSSLVARLRAGWARSDAIFRLVKSEALLDQPIPLRQPLLFYLGHIPAFSWNQVCRYALGMAPFCAEFDELFERGIDPIGIDAFEPADASRWPKEREVLDYRDRVRAELMRAYTEERQTPIFEMALEHELMHQETLLYMIQELPRARKAPEAAEGLIQTAPGGGASGSEARVSAGKARVPAGTTILGAKPGTPGFQWDNELPEREALVPAFLIDKLPVTNADYLEFVQAGGYSKRSLWSAEGWAWRERRAMQHPHGWTREGGRFFYRTLLEVLPLEAAATLPVYVSFAEAQAYCRLRGERLPTEAELHRAAYGSPDGARRRYPWGDDEPSPEHGNFDFQRLSPAPVGASPRGASAWGVADVIGNGWEWTGSAFEPFPGFEVTMPSYPGYSKDFFDGSHYVLLGASWATDRALVRRSFRNWFQPHYPYVFAKFRAVSAA